jgi:hypothetical protein
MLSILKVKLNPQQERLMNYLLLICWVLFIAITLMKPTELILILAAFMSLLITPTTLNVVEKKIFKPPVQVGEQANPEKIKP